VSKKSCFTVKHLHAAGYVEYEENKFGHRSTVKELPKQKIKKLPKIDPFLKLCEIELGMIPKSEHRFTDTRRWRMDYAFIQQMVFLEVEGGVWTGGRHTRGKGFINDMEKYNAAAALGWTLVRCVPDDLTNGKAIKQLKQILKNENDI
jgi:hypothetical protein